MRLSIPLGRGVRANFSAWWLLLLVPCLWLFGVIAGIVALVALVLWLIALAVRWSVSWWQRYPDMPSRLANLPWPPQPS